MSAKRRRRSVDELDSLLFASSTPSQPPLVSDSPSVTATDAPASTQTIDHVLPGRESTSEKGAFAPAAADPVVTLTSLVAGGDTFLPCALACVAFAIIFFLVFGRGALKHLPPLLLVVAAASFVTSSTEHNLFGLMTAGAALLVVVAYAALQARKRRLLYLDLVKSRNQLDATAKSAPSPNALCVDLVSFMDRTLGVCSALGDADSMLLKDLPALQTTWTRGVRALVWPYCSSAAIEHKRPPSNTLPSAAIARAVLVALQEALAERRSAVSQTALRLGFDSSLAEVEQEVTSRLGHVERRLLENPAPDEGGSWEDLMRECDLLGLGYEDLHTLPGARRPVSRVLEAGLLRLPAAREPSAGGTRAAPQASLLRAWDAFAVTARELLEPPSASTAASHTAHARARSIFLTRARAGALRTHLAAAVDAACAAERQLKSQLQGATLGLQEPPLRMWDVDVDVKAVRDAPLVDIVRDAELRLEALADALSSLRREVSSDDEAPSPGSVVPATLVHRAEDALRSLGAALQARRQQGARQQLMMLGAASSIRNGGAGPRTVDTITDASPLRYALCDGVDSVIGDDAPAARLGESALSHPSAVPLSLVGLHEGAAALSAAGNAYGFAGVMAAHALLVTDSFAGSLGQVLDAAREHARSHTAAFSSAMSTMTSMTADVKAELERGRCAEEEHRAQRAAERHEAAEAAALQSRRASEWRWLGRAALLSGIAAAVVLSAACWEAARPVTFAWARTFGALANPTLVCGISAEGRAVTGWLPPGPSVWGLLLRGISPDKVAASHPSSWSIAHWGGGTQGALATALVHAVMAGVSDVASWAFGGWPCAAVAGLGSAALWATSIALLWFSPSILGTLFLLACLHGSWAQLARVGWIFGLVSLPLVVLVHGTVSMAWYFTLPRCVSATELKAAFLEAMRSGESDQRPGTQKEVPNVAGGVVGHSEYNTGSSSSRARQKIPQLASSSPRWRVALAWPIAAVVMGVAAAYFALPQTNYGVSMSSAAQ